MPDTSSWPDISLIGVGGGIVTGDLGRMVGYAAGGADVAVTGVVICLSTLVDSHLSEKYYSFNRQIAT